MSVSDGQSVNAAVTNAAFISRTANSSTVGRIQLLKPTGSGALLLDLQLVINNLIAALGMVDQDSVDLSFTSNNYLTDNSTAAEALSDLDAALFAIFSGSNTWSGQNSFTGFFDLASENNAQSGSNITLTTITKSIQRLTSGSLVSISGIDNPSTNRILVIENKTGVSVTVKDNDTVNAAAAKVIRTGSGADVDVGADASLILFYDIVSSEWHILGGTGGGSSELISSDLTLTGGDTLAISTTKDRQTWLVQGNSGPVTMSTTPFGATDPVNGAEIVLIGNSDTNTVEFVTNDAANGIIGYSFTLARGQTATLKYNSTLDRYVIKSVSN